VNWNPLLLRSAAVLAIGLPIAAIPASADPAAQQPSADKVHELVARLSDDDWKARDKAQEQLAAMGEAAEGPLRERLREPKLDAEERSRVEAVLQKLEAARQSGPSRVTFRKSAAAPAEVLAAITQQTKVAFAPGTDNLLADAKPFDADFTAAPLWQASGYEPVGCQNADAVRHGVANSDVFADSYSARRAWTQTHPDPSTGPWTELEVPQ